MNLHIKKIVGYSFGRSLTTELFIKTLKNAYHTQQSAEVIVFHSDLCTQYTLDVFRMVIEKYRITHYTKYKGSPYNNACIESFHAILKKEEVNHVQYIDDKSAAI